MDYYNAEGNKVCYSFLDESFGTGKQGCVRRIVEDSTLCMKTYFDTKDTVNTIFDDSAHRFTQDMFSYFKYDFNHPSFCKLSELLYGDCQLTNVVAYMMRWYEECISNILFLPTSYILDNFGFIYDAVSRLVEDCIRVVDLNCTNILNTSDGMKVIDFDKYYRDTTTDKETLEYINKSALMYAFKGIFKNALQKHGIDFDKNPEFMRMIDGLFTIHTSPLSLKCKLRSYTKPIDLFYRR